jgi:hypothetical protein
MCGSDEPHLSRRASQGRRGRLRLKCDGTRVETRFRLSEKTTSPFKSAWGVSSLSGNNAGYTMFRGSVKSTGYPLHSPISPSLPLPCVTACHHISTGVYKGWSCTKCLYPPSWTFRNFSTFHLIKKSSYFFHFANCSRSGIGREILRYLRSLIPLTFKYMRWDVIEE